MSERLVAGRYEVVRRLAVGGMGEVLLAEFVGDDDLSPGLLVVKRTLSGPAGERPADSQLQMLREEGRLGLRLRHENIVETLRIEENGGNPLLVMELLAGRSMAQVLAQAKKRKENVPIDVALAILRGAACGLHFAHTLRGAGGAALGLVHRDISPANIFVTFDRHVKVIDFGVAKSADSEIKTATGILKGKLGYMSPEQSLGEGTLTAQADVWSLGVFFWEMLLAERLFHSPNPTATLLQISSRELTRPSATRPDVPRAVDDICMRMLTRPLDRRFASCAAIVAAIDALPDGGGVARVDIGRWLAGRFPEEADAGARDAARSAHRLRAKPAPQGLSDGAVATLPEDDADTGVMSSDLRRALLGTEPGALPVDHDDADLATVRLDANTVNELRRASRARSAEEDELATERIGPEALALARQQVLGEATARNTPAAATVPSGPPSVEPPRSPTRPATSAAVGPGPVAPAAPQTPLASTTTSPPTSPTSNVATSNVATSSVATSNVATSSVPAPPARAPTSPALPTSNAPTTPPRAPTSPALPTSSATSIRPPPTTAESTSPPAAVPPVYVATGATRHPAAPGPSDVPPPRVPSSGGATVALAPAPAETSWLAVAVATFGALVLAIGVVFSLLMPSSQPHFYAFTEGGLDIIVGDREHAPAGAAVREIVPSTNPLLRRAGAIDVAPVSEADLTARLRDSGVWDRASVPSTPRARIAALMPVVIVGLGLLALAFALPTFVVRGVATLRLVRALSIVIVLGLVGVVVQVGGLGWPGRALASSAPRLEWR
jgi:serine/threonine-protein kinase